MKVSSFLSLLLLGLLCLSLPSFAEEEKKSAVVELTDANFEHLTQATTGATTGDWFIKIYAPWCIHCKKMVPEWEKFADEYKGRLNVADLDGTVHKDTASRVGIKGYPTLIFLKEGKFYRYSGPRNSESFANFINGEYAKVTPEELGSPLTLNKKIENFFEVMSADFEHVLHYRKSALGVVFAAGAILGLGLGLLLALCCCMPSSSKKTEKLAPAVAEKPVEAKKDD